MDYTHDTLGRLSAQDAMMMESPHGTPVKKVSQIASDDCQETFIDFAFERRTAV